MELETPHTERLAPSLIWGSKYADINNLQASTPHERLGQVLSLRESAHTEPVEVCEYVIKKRPHRFLKPAGSDHQNNQLRALRSHQPGRPQRISPGQCTWRGRSRSVRRPWRWRLRGILLRRIRTQCIHQKSHESSFSSFQNCFSVQRRRIVQLSIFVNRKYDCFCHILSCSIFRTLLEEQSAIFALSLVLFESS